MNELPFEFLIQADADSFEDYFNNILMKMGEEARGSILNILPIVLRINIYIVNWEIKDRVYYLNKFSLIFFTFLGKYGLG